MTLGHSISDTPTSLLKLVRTIPVLPGHDHTLSRAEELVLRTSVLRRMRKLRQMGLAYHEYPLAEHTRYLHSIGTAYWAVRMCDGLTRSTGALLHNNNALICEMRELLGKEFSLELILRLYSIIHDVGLLPLGHTLRIQTRRFNSPDYSFIQLFGKSISDILHEIGLLDLDNAERKSLEKHLVISEAVGHAPRLLRGEISELDDTLFQRTSYAEIRRILPVLCFAYDLVHGVCAADLLDWCHRDVPAVGIQSDVPAYPFSAGAVIKVNPGEKAFPLEKADFVEPVFRYGLDCREDSGWGLNALYRLASLHQLRVEVILRGNYSGKKAIADAVLDKSIRLIESAAGEPIEAGSPPSEILAIGDDEFLALLERRLDALNPTGTMKFLEKISYFQCAIELTESNCGATFTDHLTRLTCSDERSTLELSLARFLHVPFEDVIISATPKNMQGKVPDTIVNVGDSGWQPVWMLARDTHLIPGLANLENAYKGGARISVILRQGVKFESESLRGKLRKALKS